MAKGSRAQRYNRRSKAAQSCDLMLTLASTEKPLRCKPRISLIPKFCGRPRPTEARGMRLRKVAVPGPQQFHWTLTW